MRQEDAVATFVSEDGRITFAIVADGLGGHNDGDLASRSVIRAAEIFWPNVEAGVFQSLTAELERFVAAAEEAVAALIAAGHDARSTLCCALMRGEEVAVLGIGDTRAYLIDGGRLQQMTRDDTVAEMLVRSGLLDPREQATHPDAFRLTASLGSPHIDLTRHAKLVTPRQAAVFLLCSDGVWGPLSEVEILSVFGSVPPEQAPAALVSAATQKAGLKADNASAVVFSRTETSPAASGALRWVRQAISSWGRF